MSKIGIICQLERDRYYVLTPEGDFLLRRGSPPAGKGLGDRIKLADARGAWLRGVAVAAVLTLAIISSLHLLPGAPEPASYCLALDINPSLEFVYDEYQQMLDWRAFNERGREVLADLAMPQDLYAALNSVFLRCLELELAQDDQDIFVTAPAEVPLDMDRLLGAFEGQGAKARLHLVRLEAREYNSQSGSPLRGYLNRRAGTELSESAPVAEAALENLGSELAATLEVMPWHNNPIVQAFVEQYLVSSQLVEDMLETGLEEEEIADLLELAAKEKLTPGDIFKAFKESGLPPGQFLKEHKSQGGAQKPILAGPDWLADFLAQEFGHPAGQLSSNLGKGLDPSDLQAILVLEEMGAGKLQTLIRRGKEVGIQALLEDLDVDTSEFESRRQRLEGLVAAAERWESSPAVAQLSSEYKVPRGQVLYILARGCDPEETAEILGKKPKSLKDYLDGQGAGNGKPGGQKNPQAPGQSKGNGPPGHSGPPGQSKDKRPPGHSKGKGNE
jgi:hypothetical protein